MDVASFGLAPFQALEHQVDLQGNRVKTRRGTLPASRPSCQGVSDAARKLDYKNHELAAQSSRLFSYRVRNDAFDQVLKTGA